MRNNQHGGHDGKAYIPLGSGHEIMIRLYLLVNRILYFIAPATLFMVSCDEIGIRCRNLFTRKRFCDRECRHSIFPLSIRHWVDNWWTAVGWVRE